MAVDPDRLVSAKKKLQNDSYDLESWHLVLKDAQMGNIEVHREQTFEPLVKVFPTSGRYWKSYIEQEIRARNYEKVEKLFQRSLMKVLSIDLWKTYLQYVRDTKSSLPTYKEKLAQAYDFALEKMGMDIASFPLWNDYVKFLKGVEAIGSYAENQKITAIRKVYQRGVVIPMVNIENLWKDYVVFEQGINPIIAEKMISERSRDYMNARRVTKEYEACTRGLNKLSPCLPPTGSVEEMKQIELWQKYISWERSNPLRIEDQGLITKRVMFAYEQCLLCLGHHPNIWYEAAMFLQESSSILAEKGDIDTSKQLLDQASTLYDRAISSVLQKSMLLHFAFADFEEQQMKKDTVHQIYLKYLEIEDIDPTLCYIQYMKFCRRAEGTASARNVFKKAREDARSKYHIYVAAALMEYYCTKDKKIAGNIFELGFKRFKGNPKYVLEYIDYLSHLNEDNNTRVLFERALTSGSLSVEESIAVWTKFLEFESNVGDLASIKKVEKRRSRTIEQSHNSKCSETAQLIDRYRFLELYPCSANELLFLGYPGARDNSFKSTVSSSLPSEANPVQNGTALAKPDVAQMVPFKPKITWIPGEHKLPGGGFPLPPVAAEVCQLLPPPTSFAGPFVIVDRLMEVFRSLNLPDHFPGPVGKSDYSTKLFDTASAASWSTEGGAQGGTAHDGKSHTASSTGGGGGDIDPDRKRKIKEEGGYGSDDDFDWSNAPANDIYRKRQQRRIK